MANFVVLHDVKEHLPETIAALKAAISMLKANGLLLITTGEFSSMKIAIFILYLVCTLYGLYALKTYNFGMNWEYILGFITYLLGFVIWLVVLKLYPLSLAFPVAAGALIVGTQLIGYFALGDKFDWIKMSGVLFIVLGIFTISIRGYVNE